MQASLFASTSAAATHCHIKMNSIIKEGNLRMKLTGVTIKSISSVHISTCSTRCANRQMLHCTTIAPRRNLPNQLLLSSALM